MFTLRIQDFQSLKDVEIEVQGLTVVTGQNNSGKSACVRAAFGAFTNTPGTKYVRHGAEHTSVSMEFSDGQILKWEKGSGVNRYTLNGKVLNKVGRSAPEEISCLGVQPLSVGGVELWPQFAHQFTGQIFLLDKPGSVLAEAIADVDRVGVLNDALRLSQSDQRAASSELKVRQGDISRLEVQEESFQGLDSLGVEIDALESLDREIQSTRQEIESLTNMGSRVRSLQDLVSGLMPIRHVVFPDPDRLGKLDGAYQWALSMGDRLRQAMQNLSRVSQSHGSVVSLVIPPVVDLDSDLVDLSYLYTIRDNVRSFDLARVKLQEALVLLEKETTQADLEYASLMDGIRECPVCGSLTTTPDECKTP